jgi:hypothetical protein
MFPIDLAYEILGDNYPGWEVIDDCVITCPCGNNIEWDGRCPEGCVSPFREMGMI